jgi:hypothetical protein
MIEALRLVVMALGAILLLAALGAGPTLWLGKRLAAPLALAPVAGLAVAGILLTGASSVFSMRAGALVLLLGAGISVAGALVHLARQRPKVRLREAAIPALICAVGLMLGVLPGALRGTVGPAGIHIYDAWIYIPAETWLIDHDAYDSLPDRFRRTDITLTNGHTLTSCGCRLGPVGLGASTSQIFGTTPDQFHLPLLSALLALVPAALWFAARQIGLSRSGSAAAALFGLSPAVAMMVPDSALANLSGLVLAPAVLVAGWVAMRSGRPGSLALASILLAGLVAMFPEFSFSLVVAGALAVGWVLLRSLRTGARRQARDLLARGALLVAGALILAPIAVERTYHYLTDVSDAVAPILGVPRYLTPEDFGSWLFGVQHLYELQRFDSIALPLKALAVLLPIALAAIALLGVVASRDKGILFGALPCAVGAGLALLAYLHYDHCQYCLWKSLTFTLPFLAIGIGMGLDASRSSGQLPSRYLSGGFPPMLVQAVLAVGLLAIARADLQLLRATYNSPALTQADSRGVSSAVQSLPKPASLMLEGADATSSGAWGLEELTYLAREVQPRTLPRGAPAVRLYFDPRPQTILPIFRDRFSYRSASYRYVITTFPGISSERRLIGHQGSFALFRRAPIDIVIAHTGWSQDPADGDRATPWLQGPFELWVASPRSVRAKIHLRFAGPRAGQATLVFRARGRPLKQTASGSGVCLDVDLERGRNVIRAQVDFGEPRARMFPAMPGIGLAFVTAIESGARPSEAGPMPSPPRLLTIRAAKVSPGKCRT